MLSKCSLESKSPDLTAEPEQVMIQCPKYHRRALETGERKGEEDFKNIVQKEKWSMPRTH